MSGLLEAARAYAQRGWNVFPVFEAADGQCACGDAECNRPGKHPRIDRWQMEATTDGVKIANWWTRWPQASIGIATGKTSKLTVVDADASNGKPGVINLTALSVKHNGMPRTAIANTGGGGLHAYFLYTDRLTTGTNVLAEAIDVRNDGGYVIAPPSVHVSGRQYEWQAEAAPVLACPDWLMKPPERSSDERAKRSKGTRRNRTLPEVEDMLKHVDPDDRDRWLNIGIILGRSFPEQQEEGWALYETWCARSEKFDEDRAGNLTRMREAFYERAKEPSPRGGKELTLGSLIAWAREGGWKESSIALDDFYAYSPLHSYLYRPTRDLWPQTTVNARLRWLMPPGGPSAADWLDRYRAVEAMTWHPDCAEVVEGRLPFEGGWAAKPGARAFNLYRAPEVIGGDARAAQRWRDHLNAIYPTDAAHIERWLAHRIQRPGQKINHALVLGGMQGIGKDSSLEPVKRGVGAWNWKEVSPAAMFGRFNGWVKAVVVRVSEVRDLGEVDRFKFYDHSKSYIAAPPDVIRCDEKNLREHPVFNVAGYIFTTNHKTGGLFLPPDDRRHYVAWSDAQQMDFDAEYWAAFWAWLEAEGAGAVVTYLRELALAGFDPKAPPPRTDAWWAIVQANEDAEGADLRSAIAKLDNPAVLTLGKVIDAAKAQENHELVLTLTDRKHRRRVPHLMEAADYVPVRNTATKEGRWTMDGREVTIYGRRDLDRREQFAEAHRLVDGF